MLLLTFLCDWACCCLLCTQKTQITRTGRDVLEPLYPFPRTLYHDFIIVANVSLEQHVMPSDRLFSATSPHHWFSFSIVVARKSRALGYGVCLLMHTGTAVHRRDGISAYFPVSK